MLSTPHEHLKSLCELRIPSSFNKKWATTGITQYLMEHLSMLDIPLLQQSCFRVGNNERANIMCRFKGKSDGLHIAFSAHHDVVDPHADNANDNLASVAILLALAESLADAPWPLNNTIDIFFTDGEEVGGQGARRIATSWYKRFTPVLLLNLELTAYGDCWWVEGIPPEHETIAEMLSDISERPSCITPIPFSDATIYRHAGVDTAVCIGRLPFQDMASWVQQDVPPPAWRTCHTRNDTFERANEDDMQAALTELLTVATEIDSEMLVAYDNIQH